MPFNGSGTFVRLYNWVTDKLNAIDITASRFDAEDNGFAAGLSLCVTKDGQNPAASNFLPSVDATYSLGSAPYRWVNLNLSGYIQAAGSLTCTGIGCGGLVNMVGSQPGSANTAYIQFNDSTPTQQGYVGKASGSNNDIYLANQISGGIIALATNGGAIQGTGPTAAALVDMTPDQGSWTTTISGAYSSNPSGTLKWRRVGGLVCIWAEANILAVSNSSGNLSCSGLPAAITPSANRIVMSWGGEVRGVNCPMTCTMTTSNTILLAPVLTANASNPTAVNANVANAFDSASNIGIYSGWAIWYPL
jgi:hypothetical protein